MSLIRSFTGKSAANTAKTHTITKPVASTNVSRDILIHSLTVSTSGGDIAADCTIAVNDNGTSVWEVELRNAKIYGGHFDFSSCPIPIRDGNCTIVTDAAGANVIVTVSAIYELV